MHRRASCFIIFALAASAWQLSQTANAGPITPGNLVVYRVGAAGGPALGTAGVAVTLDEYTPTGAFVQSIPVSSAGASALTAIGNSSTEGIISRSQDGTKLVFGGYRADAGAASPNVATNNRVIGSVDLNGNVDTTVAITDGGTGVPRSATTVDGTTYYMGTSTGVRYVGTPSGSATSVVIDTRNSRQVNLADNVLYASNGSSSIAAKVQSYGTLPTVATVPTVVASQATADAVNGFALFDLDAGVSGVDTLYFLNTVQSLLAKYTFDGTNWTASGSVVSGGAVDLTGVNNGGAVTLYLTLGSGIKTLTDSSGYNATITGAVGDLATPVVAGTNTAFRGIGILPIPEPASALLLLTALAWTGARRRVRS